MKKITVVLLTSLFLLSSLLVAQDRDALPGTGRAAAPTSQPTSTGLSVDDVLLMAKAGLGEDVIILAIRKDESQFELSPLQLVQLKQGGVSDSVLKVMLDPKAEIDSHPALTTGAEPAPASTVASPLGPDPEIGVYTKKNGKWVELLPEVVNWKTGGVLKMIATAGIVKGDVNGHLATPTSRNTVVTPLEFIIYMPEGIAITEYQLLRLRQNKKKSYREFRTVTGGILHTKGGAMRDLVPFEGKRLARRMYAVVLPSNLGAGEYGFLPPGAFNSANSASSLGKLFSFRILE